MDLKTDPNQQLRRLARREASLSRTERESRLRATENQRLAEAGTYKCMGRCKQVRPLHVGLVTTWGGNVLYAICPECFSGSPVVMREKALQSGGKGVWVGPLREEDRQQKSVIPVKSLSEYLPAEALAKSVKEAL